MSPVAVLLVALSGIAALYLLVIRPWQLRRGATREEALAPLPGDELVPNPKCGYTQAITIKARAHAVWPWLVQIGYKRGGWYSHDCLHRLMGIAGCVDDGRRSARRIIPKLQRLKPGDAIDIAPGMRYAVSRLEQDRALVLSARLDTSSRQSLSVDGPLPEKHLVSSWAWILREQDDATTRLIVRVRSDYSPGLLNTLASVIPGELGSLVMQPQTLRTLKRLAEGPENR